MADDFQFSDLLPMWAGGTQNVDDALNDIVNTNEEEQLQKAILNNSGNINSPSFVGPKQPGTLDTLSNTFGKVLNSMGSGVHDLGLGIGKVLGNKYAPAAIGAAGGLGGMIASSGDRKAAEQAMQHATDLASQMNYYKDPTVANIQDEASNKVAIQKALGMMSDRASMGLTPQDLADLEQIRNQQNNAFQAQQSQIQNNMARKGMSNSGAALAQMMGASQAANQQAAQNATNLSSQMFQAKQNAIQNLANMGNTNLNSQFNRDVTRASATDQFNNANTNLQNARNTAMQNAQQNMAKFKQGTAQNTAQSWGNIGGGIATTVNAANNPNANTQQKKDANGNPIT